MYSLIYKNRKVALVKMYGRYTYLYGLSIVDVLNLNSIKNNHIMIHAKVDILYSP